MKWLKSKTGIFRFQSVILAATIALFILIPAGASVINGSAGGYALSYQCGTTTGSFTAIQTSIDFGCRGTNPPIVDLIFAIIRFLSDGVGLVVVGSVIVGGIQYIGSRGEPQATAHAVNRLRSAVIALIIFIFAYALLNYVVPAGFFK